MRLTSLVALTMVVQTTGLVPLVQRAHLRAAPSRPAAAGVRMMPVRARRPPIRRASALVTSPHVASLVGSHALT
tara:strand:- start:1132 stop:1353 length:222 start_codon:yes stop_codon:yes gene_type:complete